MLVWLVGPMRHCLHGEVNRGAAIHGEMCLEFEDGESEESHWPIRAAGRFLSLPARSMSAPRAFTPLEPSMPPSRQFSARSCGHTPL